VQRLSVRDRRLEDTEPEQAMSELALLRTRQEPLRVAIVASNPARLAILAALVTDAGHAIVDSKHAEVLLGDGDVEIEGESAAPSVVLGASAHEHAGILPMTANAAQIDAALRAVAAGLRVSSAGEEERRSFDELPERASSALLTPRELQILTAISDGLSNKAIARQLAISLHTVKFHVESLFRKLEVRTRAEAVARGMEQRKRAVVDV